MTEKPYDSKYIKKIVGMLEEKHLRLEKELMECRKKRTKSCDWVIYKSPTGK